MEKRLEVIDMLRGLAALSVCWYHMTISYPAGSMIKAISKYGWLGVEVFFVISGFIIPYILFHSGYQLKNYFHIFMFKRLIRLYPPYLIAVALVLVLWHLSAIAPGFKGINPEHSTAQILLHLGYLNDIIGYPWFNPVFWTLAIEFQYYLLISLLYPLVVSESDQYRRIGMVILCLLPVLADSKAYVVGYLGLFSLGILTFQYFRKLISYMEYLIMFMLASAGLIMSLGILIAIIGMTTALVIGFLKINVSKIFIFLGTISYSLYLVHVPVGSRVVHLGQRIASTELENLFISLFGVIVSIAFASIFYIYIEKPSRAWSAKIKYI